MRWLDGFQSPGSLPIACFTAFTSLLTAAAQPCPYTNPVVPGNFPDPSVIRVGRDYWATATSGEHEPVFPLMHSTNLLSWEGDGYVFKRRPDWAVASMWAPELSATPELLQRMHDHWF